MHLYLSKRWVGKIHDFRLLKAEFPPHQKWFQKFKVRVDLGYLGMDQEDECKELRLPNKKPPKAELSAVQKEENRALASERISVEQSMGGLKRYRILSDRLRCHDADFYDQVLGGVPGFGISTCCSPDFIDRNMFIHKLG